MKLPLLLADEAACPGVADDAIALDTEDICASCRRHAAYWYAPRGPFMQVVAPAAEWSDTTNEWRCGNRLPMEG